MTGNDEGDGGGAAWRNAGRDDRIDLIKPGEAGGESSDSGELAADSNGDRIGGDGER